MATYQDPVKGARGRGRLANTWEGNRRARLANTWEGNINECTEMGFGDSLKAAEDTERWKCIIATSYVVPPRPSGLRDSDEMIYKTKVVEAKWQSKICIWDAERRKQKTRCNTGLPSFLAYLSRRPCSIGRPLSSVCMWVCVSTFSNIFSAETTGLIEATFHEEPPSDGGTKVCLNGPGHMTKMAAMPI